MLLQNHVSRSPIAASAVEFVAKISITAETDVAANRRLPLNIGLVIDRSGSMENAPIEYAKAAAIQVIEKLHEHDYCTVVIFDTEIDVLADGETMNEVNKQRLIQRINHVYARGGTDLHAGWHTCVNRQLRINNRELVGRVFLLSDGHANTGLTDVTQLGAQAAAFHRQGISTSTFGIGDGYNEVIMGALASNGEGNTHYISEVQHIEECFRQELAALFTAALRDTQLHITVPTGYSVQLVGERPHTLRDREMTIHFGTIMRAEQRNIYLHIKADTPPATGSVTMPVRATGLDAQGMSRTAANMCTWTIHSTATPTIDERIEREAAEMDAATLQQHVMQLHRRGQREAIAFVTRHASANPLFARFGVYNELIAELNRPWEEDDYKMRFEYTNSVRRGSSMSEEYLQQRMHRAMQTKKTKEVDFYQTRTSKKDQTNE